MITVVTKEGSKKLFFFDQALLNNKYFTDNLFSQFKIFLNKIPKPEEPDLEDEIQPTKTMLVLEGEVEKTKDEVEIILQVKKRIVKDMISLGRTKILGIRLSMIYVVLPSERKKYSLTFLKGIAVERRGSKYLFAAKVYQELFCRMCFSLVAAGEDKKLFYIDDGAVILRKGIASKMARKFLDEVNFIKDTEEDPFNLDGEKIVEVFLKENLIGGLNFKEREDAEKNFFSSVINGTAFPAILQKEISSVMNESVNVLNLIIQR